jgi:hypothetical protein
MPSTRYEERRRTKTKMRETTGTATTWTDAALS